MVTILDYGAGNLTSVKLAFERLGEAPVCITDASQYQGGPVVFPGVGSAGSGMAGLRARSFDQLLRRLVDEGTTPVLGICLGMQLLLETTEEDGGVSCLGLLPGDCRQFDRSKEPECKVPHMGWNRLRLGEHPLFEGLPNDPAVYFVHSYFVTVKQAEHQLATCDYCGERFAAVVGSGNLCAMQFHPERSGELGARMLQNFLNWKP